MKVLRFTMLGALFLIAMTLYGCPRYAVYRTPRMVVETLRSRRCVGKRKTYFCRYRRGHLNVEIMRCRRGYRRWITDRRRWVTPEPRCRNHEFIRPGDGPGPRGGDGPPPQGGPLP